MTNIVYVIGLYIICACAVFFVVTASTEDLWFNPKYNYEKWHILNWFGVWFLTIAYWVVFFPITIMILICWLFTVGRE